MITMELQSWGRVRVVSKHEACHDSSPGAEKMMQGRSHACKHAALCCFSPRTVARCRVCQTIWSWRINQSITISPLASPHLPTPSCPHEPHATAYRHPRTFDPRPARHIHPSRLKPEPPDLRRHPRAAIETAAPQPFPCPYAQTAFALAVAQAHEL